MVDPTRLRPKPLGTRRARVRLLPGVNQHVRQEKVNMGSPVLTLRALDRLVDIGVGLRVFGERHSWVRRPEMLLKQRRLLERLFAHITTMSGRLEGAIVSSGVYEQRRLGLELSTAHATTVRHFLADDVRATVRQRRRRRGRSFRVVERRRLHPAARHSVPPLVITVVESVATPRTVVRCVGCRQSAVDEQFLTVTRPDVVVESFEALEVAATVLAQFVLAVAVHAHVSEQVLAARQLLATLAADQQRLLGADVHSVIMTIQTDTIRKERTTLVT